MALLARRVRLTDKALVIGLIYTTSPECSTTPLNHRHHLISLSASLFNHWNVVRLCLCMSVGRGCVHVGGRARMCVGVRTHTPAASHKIPHSPPQIQPVKHPNEAPEAMEPDDV